MTREFCSYCGTVTNEGERMCQTRAESDKCAWMGGVHRGAVVVPGEPECVTPQDTTPPELKAVLAEALAKQKP